MPADIINLRRARKAKARIDKASQAAENRVVFGRSKADRETLAADRKIATRRLDGHQLGGTSKRDGDDGGGESGRS